MFSFFPSRHLDGKKRFGCNLGLWYTHTQDIALFVVPYIGLGKLVVAQNIPSWATMNKEKITTSFEVPNGVITIYLPTLGLHRKIDV